MFRTRTNSMQLRAAAVAAAATLAFPAFFASCAGAPPPFATPTGSLQGFKSRTFVGTPAELRPSVVAALNELGFEVHAEDQDLSFLTATRGMSAAGPAASSGRRNWTRVGVLIRQVDMHRRAPRTIIEIDAEPIEGSFDGVIEASAGSVPSSFYEDFFQSVTVRVEDAARRTIRGFLPPA